MKDINRFLIHARTSFYEQQTIAFSTLSNCHLVIALILRDLYLACIMGVRALSCLGGTVYFARTGKLNINISPQNCWRVTVTKTIFPDIAKNYFRTYQKLVCKHIIYENFP